MKSSIKPGSLYTIRAMNVDSVPGTQKTVRCSNFMVGQVIHLKQDIGWGGELQLTPIQPQVNSAQSCGSQCPAGTTHRLEWNKCC